MKGAIEEIGDVRNEYKIFTEEPVLKRALMRLGRKWENKMKVRL
jgi:hypothetical protein